MKMRYRIKDLPLLEIGSMNNARIPILEANPINNYNKLLKKNINMKLQIPIVLVQNPLYPTPMRLSIDLLLRYQHGHQY